MMFLTPQELEALTGYLRQFDQRRWLVMRQWAHETNSSGRPIVLRSYAETKLGGLAVTQTFEPNFAAIRKAG